MSTDYDPETPAAILEYLEDGELVRVKFAGQDPDTILPNGGAGGAL